MKNNTVYYWKICNALICFIRFHTYLEEKKWRQHSWLKQIWGLSRRYFCSLYVKTFKAKFNDFTRSSDVCMHVLWVCIYMYGYLFMNMMYITLSFSLFHIKLLHLTIIIDIANKSRWLHNNSLWLAGLRSNNRDLLFLITEKLDCKERDWLISFLSYKRYHLWLVERQAILTVCVCMCDWRTFRRYLMCVWVPGRGREINSGNGNVWKHVRETVNFRNREEGAGSIQVRGLGISNRR